MKRENLFFSPLLGGRYLRYMGPRVLLLLFTLAIIEKVANSYSSFPRWGFLVQILLIPIFLYILWKSAVDLNRIDEAHTQELEKRLDYETLFNLSQEMFCIAGIDGYYKNINLVFQKTLGYPLSILLNVPYVNFIHPDDRQTMIDEEKKLAFEKDYSYFENRYICRNGEIKTFGWTATKFKEGLIFFVARDLTRIKKVEEDLTRTNKFSEAILDNVPNMIFVKDAKSLTFLNFNKAGEELIGLSREELIGKNDHDLFPEEQADAFMAIDRLVLKGRKVIEIPEEPILTQNHGERLLRTKKIPIYNQEGNPLYLLGISEDITEVKRLNAEKERSDLLIKSAERISVLIDHSLEGIVGMNNAGLVVAWNPQAEKIFGFNKEDVLGKKIADIIIPERFRQAHTEGIKKFNQSHHGPMLNHRVELYALKNDGIEFPIEISITPIDYGGEFLFYAFVRDISERKLYEKHQKDLIVHEHEAREAAERSINMRDDFLSIAAHELKTPITPITMQLQMLERALIKNNDPVLLRITQSSKKEMDRLTRLIDELLDVSRISAGRLLLNLEEVNLKDLIEAVIKRYENHCTIHSSLDSSIVGRWDFLRLESVVENLLTNAIKYGNNSLITIEAHKKNNMAILSVQDRGIGISLADQERIFESFERAVSVRKYSGLGLGLYITKKIVESHGGTIKLKSESGKGSVFSVELPLRGFS